MEFLFKRYFWILNIVLLVVTGFVAARAISAYVEYEVFKVPYVDASGSQADTELDEDGGLRPDTSRRSVDLERRKQLAEEAASKKEEKVAEPTETLEDKTDNEPFEEEPIAPGTNIQVEVIAAVTAERHEASLALVKVEGGEGQWVTVGSELKPGFDVTDITRTHLVINQKIFKELWGTPEPVEPEPRLAGPSRSDDAKTAAERRRERLEETRQKTKPAASTKSKIAEGIKQTGAWDYRINRNMLDEQLQDLGELGRQARVIPNFDRDSGTYKGFKLIGVRPNSLYRSIGIRSGDVILRVNGEELSNPGKALELFSKLQTSNDITLDIGRRGQNHTLSYKIE